MVNNQKFLTWVSNPQTISAQDLDDLKEITDTYPFCNIAHALLAKGHHNIKSEGFTENLHTAAIYAVDRRLLRQLIEGGQKQPMKEDRSLRESPKSTPKAQAEDEEESYEKTAGNVKIEPNISLPEETDADKLHRELQENLKQLHQHKSPQKEQAESQAKLIDQFIEKDPKIAKPDLKQAQQKQEDLSLKSQKVKGEIASENLALIMARQGKTHKAINIYQKLILKFPEKKAYFASQIEELKKK